MNSTTHVTDFSFRGSKIKKFSCPFSDIFIFSMSFVYDKRKGKEKKKQTKEKDQRRVKICDVIIVFSLTRKKKKSNFAKTFFAAVGKLSPLPSPHSLPPPKKKTFLNLH